MNLSKLGNKIKTLRTSQGLTQNQLTDGYMTRNMLSLIESGNAAPSLETAEYIANKLNVPLSFLLSDDDDGKVLERALFAERVRNLFSGGQYDSCIEALRASDADDCETNYIYAYSLFYYAKRLTEGGSFKEAQEYLKLALEKCKKTTYDTSMIEAAAPLYMSISANVQSPLLELDCEKYEKSYAEAFEYELYKYLISDLDFPFSNPLFKKHAEAKSLLKKYSFYEAIRILKEIEEASNTAYNAFVKFGVYTDLENAYKEIGDFENAYRYSAKRLTMLNIFSR